MQYVILGTAGHIDHGKSALVKALTGIDPDRLKEEKDRGMTIDLGFADLPYPDGLTVGIVDVPGHERLVRNMLAGAGGIDLVLFVIAADESIMPQSREHLHICNLLRIKSGIVALTKADLVEEDWLHLVEEDIRLFMKGTFLEHAPIVPVSSKTLFQIDLLKEAIRKTALSVEPKSAKGLYRLPIDRVLTLKGFGTIITGTAFGGSISVGENVEILPSGIRSKVRGLHSHGKAIKTAYAGRRVAMNLQGVEKNELKRGDCVVMPDRVIPTTMIDAKLELLLNVPPLKSRDLIHLHVGTSEVMARVVLYGRNELRAGESCFCQFRLREHVIALSGDRYIIRRYSPIETIGGGEVYDPSSHKMSHKRSIEDLKIFETGLLGEKIAVKVKRTGMQGIELTRLEGWINAETEAVHETVASLKHEGTVKQFENILLHKSTLDFFRGNVQKSVQDFHGKNPLKPGMQKEELRSHIRLKPKLFDQMLTALEDVIVDRDTVRLHTFSIALSKEDETLRKAILEVLGNAGFQPLTAEELCHSLGADEQYLSQIMKLMVKEGSLVKINNSFYLPSYLHERMMERLKDFAGRRNEMRVSEFREMLGTSRKYAVVFLEYLDANNITRKTDDRLFASTRIIRNL